MRTYRCFYSALVAVTTFAAAISCTKENIPSDEPAGNPSGKVTISATLSDALTKVSFTPYYDMEQKPEKMFLAWSAGDAVRVYDHADRSKYDDFTLEAASVGMKTGVFAGTPSNIASATSFDVEVIAGAGFDYAVQTQPSDGETTNLKYLASASNLSSYDSIVFTDFSSVLSIAVKMPSSAIANTIKSIDLKASQNIFNGGNQLSITFDTVGDADFDGLLRFYATLPQGNTAVPAGTTLLVHFNAPEETHDVYTRFLELGEQTIKANKLNTISINAEKCNIHAGVVSCDGTTAEKAYLVGDKYQMQAMFNLMVADAIVYFKQVDDIDMAGVDWKSLNNASPYSKGINFDGGEHTVSNLTCGSTYDYPSFAGILRGTVSNVTFKDAVINSGSKKAGVVAGYVGHKSNGYKAYCSNVIIDHAQVNTTALAGILGAQGDNIGSLDKCSVINGSTVTSSSARVGGMIGSLVQFEEIKDCCVEGATVASDSYYVGGLVGQMDGGGVISGCHTSGTVVSNNTSYARSGGLVGYAISGTLQNCYSTCAVDVKGQFAGGFVGDVKGGTITKCHSTGSVTSANHYCGGLIGTVTGEVAVDKSYFDAAISLPTGGSGKAQAGGIISYMDSGSKATIANCYTSGSWAGRRWFGGIVGGTKADATSLSVTNCYTTASITGTPYGALIGSNSMTGSVSCSGLIAWWESGSVIATGSVTAVTSGYYIGQEGTLSAKAAEMGWDSSIWDLTGSIPTLK